MSGAQKPLEVVDLVRESAARDGGIRHLLIEAVIRPGYLVKFHGHAGLKQTKSRKNSFVS